MYMKTTFTLVLMALLSVAFSLANAQTDEYVLDPSIASEVNSQRTTWHATINNVFKNYKISDVEQMMGTEPTHDPETPKTTASDQSVPTSFDSRNKWSNCIHSIRNQKRCGSCWAFSLSEVLSDRFCIVTNGSTDVVLSPEYLLQCNTKNHGCRGGFLPVAWRFVKQNGLPTDQCDPYTSGDGRVNSQCPNSCKHGSRFKLYSASQFTHVGGSDFGQQRVTAIQQEIQNNGPVQGAFTVYRDFMHYNGGVYKHTTGRKLGGHAIKIIGWGTQQGTPYWLVANSWGSSWGLNGYFKILRGQNECGIESSVYSGVPQTGSQ